MASAPLLSAQNLSKNFGIGTLFEGISLVVEEYEKIALIGPNGSGKSTLLRMLAGLEEADNGAVRPKRDLRCIYVAQEDRFEDGASVGETLQRVLIDAGENEHEIEGKVAQTLGQCGFQDQSQLVSSLSGGWRKRLSLARGLILDPELLLLDEPTNHLDIEGVLWLEELLSEASFGLVFVSHDRYFIERLATRVIEINRQYPQGFFSAKGDYGDFLEARADFLAGLRQTQSSLSNRVRREIEWLRQGAKARTTKSKHRTSEALNLIDELKGFNLDEKRAVLEFASSKRKSKDLIKVEGVSKSFAERTLFKDVTLTLAPGVRLGIVGANGSGKTSFVRMLLGQLAPDTGTVVHANNLKFAFFDQARRQLDPTQTLGKTLCPYGDAVIFNGSSMHVTSWARRFLFTNDQLALPVKSLSGGEQARALLAKVMITEADVILFDEPTNDLDINTLEVLEESFCEYPGAIVLVTHDRYLLDRTATTILGISPQGASMFGSYSQWEQAKLISTKGNERQKTIATPILVNAKPKVDKNLTKLGYQERRELGSMESKIMKAEEELGLLQSKASSAEIISNPTKLKECYQDVSRQQKIVEELYIRWEELETRRKNFD